MRRVVTIPNKGDLVAFSWLEAKPLGSYSLAGAQMKIAASKGEIRGRVAHVRGDHPTEPTLVGVWLDAGEGFYSDRPMKTEHCEKCNRLEVGPFDIRYLDEIKAPGSS